MRNESHAKRRLAYVAIWPGLASLRLFQNAWVIKLRSKKQQKKNNKNTVAGVRSLGWSIRVMLSSLARYRKQKTYFYEYLSLSLFSLLKTNCIWNKFTLCATASKQTFRWYMEWRVCTKIYFQMIHRGYELYGSRWCYEVDLQLPKAWMINGWVYIWERTPQCVYIVYLSFCRPVCLMPSAKFVLHFARDYIELPSAY